ncbi:ScbA/BarX family gamma-butyrolactone biosynthesis protein [Kribbella sp. NPDC056861]|uniref:ScbA/BarX family gamma-butyrolactone biosynthesis protein n=1 Tax=Kribbella sp. NPDC056861 TaxID=3154857 RepID=UPI00344483F6
MTNSTAAPPPGTAEIRTLVRKDQLDEALVVDWGELPELGQRVTVRWPAKHTFYCEEDRYTPLLFTESLRQALALLSHRVHEIPLGHRLGWERIRSWICPATLDLPADGKEVTLEVTHPAITRRRMGSVFLVSRIEASTSGRPVGGAEVHYSAHPPAIYDRLRGPYASAKESFSRAIPLTSPVSPTLVGRQDPRNVVLSPTDRALRWQLRVDTSHSVLFDHPHDHVPGMVLLEAAAQAAQAALPIRVTTTGFDTEFFRYVEFDQPCHLTANPGPMDERGRTTVQITATQQDKPVLNTLVTTELRSR